jgi:uncharacterized membrane protein
MFLTVISNLGYHLSQRTIVPTINPLISLLVTYVIALTATLIAIPFFSVGDGGTLIAQIKSANWASYALGLAAVGLELGFLLAYRSGWKVSLAALYSNSFVTLLLIPIGVFFFHEQVGLKRAAGIMLASVGLWLISGA